MLETGVLIFEMDEQMYMRKSRVALPAYKEVVSEVDQKLCSDPRLTIIELAEEFPHLARTTVPNIVKKNLLY